jgi:hypothetical protein
MTLTSATPSASYPSEPCRRYAAEVTEKLEALARFHPTGTCASNIATHIRDAIDQIEGEIEYCQAHKIP